jgi:hypothetical protein
MPVYLFRLELNYGIVLRNIIDKYVDKLSAILDLASLVLAYLDLLLGVYLAGGWLEDN